MEMNFYIFFVAAIIPLVIGFFWYGPLFGNAWMKEMGFTKESLQDPSSYYLNCGLFIRDFSIDELPNLINILKGEMNFIGPRPALYNEYELINKREQLGVNNLKPGITGWAQVNGCRGETRTTEDMQERVDFDLSYIHRWSFWLDCQIILQTVINFFRGDQNAY